MFSAALNIKKNDLVAICGAGGKTSLMFQLAKEAKARNEKVLVATTTKISIPKAEKYDFIDFLGSVFSDGDTSKAAIYVNAPISENYGKAGAIDFNLLKKQRKLFDLVLIEADGAAAKPLKGWESYEPVIPDETTKTIGILDIETVGQPINDSLIHRLEIFCKLTDSKINTPLTTNHLEKIISHENGLFQYGKGEQILYINKVENEKNIFDANQITKNINIKVVAGSLKKGIVNDTN